PGSRDECMCVTPARRVDRHDGRGPGVPTEVEGHGVGTGRHDAEVVDPVPERDEVLDRQRHLVPGLDPHDHHRRALTVNCPVPTGHWTTRAKSHALDKWKSKLKSK